MLEYRDLGILEPVLELIIAEWHLRKRSGDIDATDADLVRAAEEYRDAEAHFASRKPLQDSEVAYLEAIAALLEKTNKTPIISAGLREILRGSACPPGIN